MQILELKFLIFFERKDMSKESRREFLNTLSPLAAGGLIGHTIGKHQGEKNRKIFESQVNGVAKELNDVAGVPEYLMELVKRLNPEARRALLEAINNMESKKKTE